MLEKLLTKAKRNAPIGPQNFEISLKTGGIG
jgi:hypothetical protein